MRPIAIQEALVKIVESANIVELLSGIRPAIGPRQFGVGPSGTRIQQRNSSEPPRRGPTTTST